MLFNFHVLMNFPVSLLFLISSFIPLWLEKILHLISVFQTLLACILWPIIWSPGECSILREKNVFCCFWLGCSMSVRSSWVTVLFKSSISLLIFSLVFLFIIEDQVLVSNFTVNCFSLQFCQVLFPVFWDFFIRCIYIYNYYTFLIVWPFHQYTVFLFVILLKVHFV